MLILLLCFQLLKAQTRAITDLGDTIYVYPNGTWSYEESDEMPELQSELGFLNDQIEIDTIETIFSVPEAANKTLENANKQFVINYNDNVWKRLPPASLNEDAEFALQGKNTDIWCIIISEETTIPPDKLFRIAKQTMQTSTGSNVDIIKAEIRKVNNTEVLRGTLKADISGISFIFDTYYFSNSLGSVQFTTWTSDKLWEKNEDQILDLLNGFKVTM